MYPPTTQFVWQLLDLPGIIEGAAHGKGRGRQVRVTITMAIGFMVRFRVEVGVGGRLGVRDTVRVCTTPATYCPPLVDMPIQTRMHAHIPSTNEVIHCACKIYWDHHMFTSRAHTYEHHQPTTNHSLPLRGRTLTPTVTLNKPDPES